MKDITGDLIDMAVAGQFDVIVQGCNCFNTMGSGLALNLKTRFPPVFAADQATRRGDRAKLGTFTSVELPGDAGHRFTVVNAYTQYFYGRTGDLFEYDSFERILKNLSAAFPDARFGFPLIGAVRAGGDQARILGLIQAELGDRATVVRWSQEPAVRAPRR